MSLTRALFAVVICLSPAVADEPRKVTFTVRTEVAHKELNPGFCWFHPRVAAIPDGAGAGKPRVVMTIQKHLVASDHYSGLYTLQTDDLGKTWSKPREIPELAWTTDTTGADIAVADVTPMWHPQQKKLIAVGTKVRYSKSGEQLAEVARSHDFAYAVYDPASDKWTKWRWLDLPDPMGRFYMVAPGCVQWRVEPDGRLLVPMYFKGKAGSDYTSTVLHCTFDGQTIHYVKHGDELAIVGGRGLVEPSLTFHRRTYYLTLRNDARGYVTTSADALKWEPLQPWQFDDGSDLGSYNTQQHWVPQGEGLFLSYTRRGANNDHIARNRAPLFIAEVDPATKRVIRMTEQVLIPERGVMLGNFGAAAITPEESWVTDAEYILTGQPDPRGADGSVFVARVKWAFR